MKLSKLKHLTQIYDQRKGLIRKLFGDAVTIKVLKELIYEKERTSENEDPNITLKEYKTFAQNKGYVLDLSEAYLSNGRASAQLFQEWSIEEIVQNVINEHVSFEMPNLMIEPISTVHIPVLENTPAILPVQNFLQFSDGPSNFYSYSHLTLFGPNAHHLTSQIHALEDELDLMNPPDAAPAA